MLRSLVFIYISWRVRDQKGKRVVLTVVSLLRWEALFSQQFELPFLQIKDPANKNNIFKDKVKACA